MKVIIVGAGVAGLSAARTLVRRGIDCLIIEARNRIGGRIWTLRDPEWACPLELGAEFIHGTPAATSALLDELRLSPYELPDRHLFHRREHGSSRFEEMPDFWERMDRVIGGVPRRGRDIPFAQHLARKWARRRDKRLARAFVEGFHAADPAEISQLALARETESSAQIDVSRSYRVLGKEGLLGYGSLPEGILRSLAPDRFQLELETRLRRVSWERGHVDAIVQRRGSGAIETISASAMILTVPPGPFGEIQFAPHLPSKHKALAFMRTGEVIKVLLRFRERFWEKSLPQGFGFLHSTNRLFPTWWSAEPFRWPLLTGWTGGIPARELSHLPQDDLLALSAASLARIFRMSSRSVMDLVEAIHVHDWQTDPYAQGAYGYLKVGGAEAPATFAEPLQDTLYFAGEASEGAGLNGTVDGALRSGIRAAEQLLAPRQARLPTGIARAA